MVRTNQGGSILGFLIVAGVLVLLLVGGAYFVRHNLASGSQDTEVAVQQEEKDSDQPVEDKTDGFETEQPSQDEEPEQPPRSEDKEQPDDGETPLPSTGHQGNNGTPGTLPQTGIEDTFLGALMLGGLAALLVLYRRSRLLATSL